MQVGDVVHLNSGSPPLTVRHVRGDDVVVTWVGDDGTLRDLRAPAVCFFAVPAPAEAPPQN